MYIYVYNITYKTLKCFQDERETQLKSLKLCEIMYINL